MAVRAARRRIASSFVGCASVREHVHVRSAVDHDGHRGRTIGNGSTALTPSEQL